MKKMLALVGVAFAAIFVTTGCISANTNDAAVAAPVVIEKKKLTPDLAITDQKVSGTAQVNALFGCITWGVSERADDAFVTTSNLPAFASPATVAKEGATFNACKAAKADYILGAKYRIDTKDYFVYKTVKCSVTGYPAVLKGVK